MEKELEQWRQESAAYRARVAELELLNEELTDFMENAALPLHWVNHLGIITWANQAELSALGYSREEYIGQPISDFHADPEVIADILSRLRDNETLHNYRARLKCKDGTLKHVLISSNVLRRDGKFIHTRCFTRDITPMVLEEQRKNDFVSMVSHELKTPLTSVLSYVQVLLARVGKWEDPFLTQALKRTERHAKNMARMINDFLNMSRLEEAKVQLALETFTLHELMQEMIQEVQLAYEDANIELAVGGLATIRADRGKLGQVLINLLSNAVKYSAKGGLITAGYEKLGPNVKIFVRDRGMGIHQADLERLFQRFFRVENSHTDRIPGFGIGLYLVAEILRYHETRVEVESVPGAGSVFSFLLPLTDINS